jgi:hypothetical protein
MNRYPYPLNKRFAFPAQWRLAVTRTCSEAITLRAALHMVSFLLDFINQ